MGNSIIFTSPAKCDKNVLPLLKKVKLIQCFSVYDDYFNTFYPNTDLYYKDFENIFSPILNGTQKYFKKF
jgi:hypothetical protein